MWLNLILWVTASRGRLLVEILRILSANVVSFLSQNQCFLTLLLLLFLDYGSQICEICEDCKQLLTLNFNSTGWLIPHSVWFHVLFKYRGVLNTAFIAIVGESSTMCEKAHYKAHVVVHINAGLILVVTLSDFLLHRVNKSKFLLFFFFFFFWGGED